jgi:hypothetical protein
MNKIIIAALAFIGTSCANPQVIVVQGKVGADGLNSLIAMAPSTACDNGGSTVLSGLDSDRNGVLDAIEVTASADLCNGRDGAAGEDGEDGEDAVLPGFTPVAVVDVCGDAPGVYDEVLLRLANGQLLASFSDNASGANTRFSILTPGTYRSTDGSNCMFTVHSNGLVTW